LPTQRNVEQAYASEPEHIGYFSASIKAEDLGHVRQTMRAHGIYLQKSNEDPADDWWFFLLPKGSTKLEKARQGAIPHYTVRLPDGYSFTLEMSPLNRDGYFISPPLIFLDTPEEKT
jgi:hypothetical protein